MKILMDAVHMPLAEHKGERNISGLNPVYGTASPSAGKRVVHMAGTDRGGIWMAEQLRELQARGYQVKAYISGEGELSDRLKTCGVAYSVVPMDAAWSLNQIPKFLKNVYGLAFRLWRERFDVVHSHLFPTTIIARFASWIADAPVRVSMIPGPFYMEAESPPILEMATAWMDSRIIPSCEFTRSLYLSVGAPAKKLELVYYGPDEKKFDVNAVDRRQCKQSLLSELGLPSDTMLVGLVAYFYPVLPESDFVPKYLWNRAIKNHDTVIEAVPYVVARCPEAHFVMVGDGWGEQGAQYLESMQELVRTRDLIGKVSFLGSRTNVPELIACFDVSLQVSLNENLGGTIESLLMERPIVGTRVGGIVDSVIHEKTGLLVDKDSPDELAVAIVRLLTDRKFASDLAKNGRALMLEKFSLARTTDDLDAVYSRCLGENQAASFVGRSNYRLWVIPVRALACLWWMGLCVMLFCKAEIRGRLGSMRQQTTSSFLNRWYTLRHRLAPLTSGSLSLPVGVSSGIQARERCLLLVQFAGEVLAGLTTILRQAAVRWLEWSLRASYLLVKRTLDICLASFLLALFVPVFALLLPLYLANKTAPFESRTFLGKGNKAFSAFLLSPIVSSNPAVSRLTAMFCLAPCLLNVLSGQISIVGTRLRSGALDLTGPDYLAERWHMAPGLTGWCQLNMSGAQNQETLNGYDFLYIAGSSLVLDFKILIKTCVCIVVTFTGRQPLIGWVPD